MNDFQISSVLVAFLCGIGISASHAAEISLVPVSATTPYEIEGNEITVFTGATTVTLELRISDWDPDQDGDPLVHLYQTTIDATGYTSGSSGSLSVTKVACSTDDDCFTVSVCEETGFCNDRASAFIDSMHPNFIFYGLQPLALVDVSTPNFRLGALIFSSNVGVADQGEAKYAGTLVLDVSGDATGSFTVGLTGDGRTGSFLNATDNHKILPLDLISAVITIVQDCNGNAVPDPQDISNGVSDDCNGNGRPDECEADCNNNGTADDCDITQGQSLDCNTNSVPDECEPDCNGNQVADECDIAAGSSSDCNENIVPDECEPGWSQDCNGNNQADLCDLFDGTSADCNNNATPDECDIMTALSEDCTGDGRPDECEPDCNRTGLADSCDIMNGTSEDLDQDGVPDECVNGFSLLPVSANVGHLLQGNEIIVPAGGATVTLEIRASGWDPGLSGALELRSYQATIDSSGYTSGDSGALNVTSVPCTTDDDCFAVSSCEIDGYCNAKGALYVNRLHPNFVFFGKQAGVVAVTNSPDVVFGATMAAPVGVGDPGVDRYAGTLTLDVSPDATGTFTLGFVGENSNFGILGADQHEPIDIAPAFITVLDDCNENGVSDDVDITDGTSEDADGNGVPDECEVALPSVSADGGRYLSVTPAPGTERVALRVTSPQFPCLVQYIDLDGSIGRLVDTPVFALPEEWGTLSVADSRIVPGITYQVRAVFENGELSLMAAATTPAWGDVRPPFGDIDMTDAMRAIAGFEHQVGGPPVKVVDLHPQVPDGVVDVDDILAVLDAYRGMPFPFGGPCVSDTAGDSGASAATADDPVTITLQSRRIFVPAGRAVDVDVFASGGVDAANLRAYQAAVVASGGRAGKLTLEEVFVNTDDPTFAFAAAEHITAADWAGSRLGAALVEGGIALTEPVYLGTFRFRVSSDAQGTFTVALRADASTFLRDSSNASIPYLIGRSAFVRVPITVRPAQIYRKRR